MTGYFVFQKENLMWVFMIATDIVVIKTLLTQEFVIGGLELYIDLSLLILLILSMNYITHQVKSFSKFIEDVGELLRFHRAEK